MINKKEGASCITTHLLVYSTDIGYVFDVYPILQFLLIVSYQQFVDRFPFLGDGADRAEDAQPLDMEAVVQVVEEGIGRVLFARVRVGKHSFAAGIPQVPAELGQADLVVVVEVVRHVGGAAARLVDRLVRWIKVEEGFLSGILRRPAVVSIQDDDSLQQFMVQAEQVLFQYFRTVARTERHGELAAAVYRIDAVVAGAHEEDEQRRAGDIVRTTLVEECASLHEVRPSVRVLRQGMVFFLDTIQCLDQFLRGVLDDTVHVHQALVGIVDHAADTGMGLS